LRCQRSTTAAPAATRPKPAPGRPSREPEAGRGATVPARVTQRPPTSCSSPAWLDGVSPVQRRRPGGMEPGFVPCGALGATLQPPGDRADVAARLLRANAHLRALPATCTVLGCSNSLICTRPNFLPACGGETGSHALDFGRGRRACCPGPHIPAHFGPPPWPRRYSPADGPDGRKKRLALEGSGRSGPPRPCPRRQTDPRLILEFG